MICICNLRRAICISLKIDHVLHVGFKSEVWLGFLDNCSRRKFLNVLCARLEGELWSTSPGQLYKKKISQCSVC
jgi:hypothetical protein